MIFTDTEFWLCLFLLFIILKFAPRKSYPYIVCAFSVFLYGSLNFSFLIPLFFCLLVDFIFALKIQKSVGGLRKALMIFGISINLGLLFYYKYYFTVLSGANSFYGLNIDVVKPLFPIGISFYIFQSISYLLDVYKNKTPAERNFFVYVLYVTFFPQLVIGPIEKGHHLIPQFKNLKFIGLENCEESLHLILYGLFKKIYVGNSLTLLIETNLNRANLDLPNMIFVSVITTFKVYADFSGYSDIARGIGKMLNIELMINFLPFFKSKNPGEFWARWHLSLTSWVREYLFPTLAGRRPDKTRFFTALFLSFVIIGAWHGPTLNWILFGVFHGIIIIIYQLLKKNKTFQKIPDNFGYIFMFFFYAVCGFLQNNSDLGKFDLQRTIASGFSSEILIRNITVSIVLIGPLMIFDRLRLNEGKEFFLQKCNITTRYAVYMLWFITTLLLNHSNESFVYYQF